MRWKEISGTNGEYQVSDSGKIRRNGKEIEPREDASGYLKVNLSTNGSVRTVEVHRLVAEAFVPKNGKTGNSINHKDENKHNNHASNLEWMTIAEQNRYGTRSERARMTLKRKAKE